MNHIFVMALLIAAIQISRSTLVEAKIVPEHFFDQMLRVTEKDFSEAFEPLSRCYELLDELRANCDQSCRETTSDDIGCRRECWASWKYGRLTCRFNFRQI